MKIKLLSILLVFALVLTLVPTFTISVCAVDTGTWSWTVNTTETLVGGVSGNETNLPDATVGEDYQVVFKCAEETQFESNYTCSFNPSLTWDSLEKLPTYPSLLGDGYTLEGQPTTAGTYEITCTCDSYSKTFTLTVKSPVCYIDKDTTDGGFDQMKDKKYTSVQAAVNAAGATPTTIVMIADSTENLTISADADSQTEGEQPQNITLDLNGYVLCGKDANKSVICIEQKGDDYGNLTIKDSNINCKSQKFKVAESGLWELYTGSDAATYTFATENGLRTTSDDRVSADIPSAGSIIEVTGGCITGGSNAETSGGGVENWGIFNFEGGNIVGNKSEYGGGIWTQYEAFVSGGNIIGNTAVCGGGIWSRATANISKGNILYNSAETNGGAICNDGGELNLSGGAISGNRAGEKGGGVYNTDGQFNLSGGEISKNTAASGGGIYHESHYIITDPADPNGINYVNLLCGSLIIGGRPVVNNNTLIDTTISNLYIYENAPNNDNYPKTKEHSVEIGTGGTVGVPVPAEGMSIGVTLGTDTGMGQFTSNGAKTDEMYFFSDNITYGVNFNTDHLELNTAYEIENNASESKKADKHGYIEVAASAAAGATVSITTHPEDGYELDTLSVQYFDGTEDKFLMVNEGKFTMICQIVGVDATFKLAHTHSWTYALSKTTTDNDTITATCSGTGTHSGTNPETLTIVAPTLTKYGETGKSEKATLSAANLGEYSVSADNIQYVGTGNTTYAESTTPPTAAGTYKASITVGGKTAYVAYTITSPISDIIISQIGIIAVETGIIAAVVKRLKASNGWFISYNKALNNAFIWFRTMLQGWK